MDTAPGMEAWFEAFGTIDEDGLAGRLDALSRQGITLRPRSQGRIHTPGIVFFDTISPALNLHLQRLAEAGGERILGITLRSDVREHEGVWTLLEAGASEMLAWEENTDAAAIIAARLMRWQSIDRLLDAPLVRANLIGQAKGWRSALRQVVEVARFTDAPILILGESGTGKELIARLIHALDPREGKRDLVVLDCATVVAELAGSEFFGHERGAFTGALQPRDGAFKLADGGTLFLDEIGDLPPALQAQLLRAVQERTYKPVGGNRWHAVQFRLICATHRPLEADVAAGTFRADLFYRIAAVVCRVPSLRERPEDILPLFQHFVRRYAQLPKTPEIDEPVRRLLLRRPFPGNVRELQQLARRAACRHVGDGAVSIGDIPEEERPRSGEGPSSQEDLELAIRRELARGVGLREISRAAAAAAIRVALSDADGSVKLAARRLRVTDRALQLRRAGDPRDRSGRRPA
jgi:transcriptional regulator with GAF, ATPase, and Fis domain